MSVFSEINALLEAVPLDVHPGYAPSGAPLPYVVHRPLYIDEPENAIAGNSIDWDYQTSLYACGASVEASFNLALIIMQTLQGARVGGTTLSTSMGYSGAQVEGHYNTQVTVQLNQGAL